MVTDVLNYDETKCIAKIKWLQMSMSEKCTVLLKEGTALNILWKQL